MTSTKIARMRRAAIVAGCLALPTVAHAADRPWPSNNWRADVDEIRQGRRLHTRLVGVETHTEQGARVTVTCTTIDRRQLRGVGFAQMRQDDFEGDILGVGSFSIRFPGRTLTWFDNEVCARGHISWHKL